MQSPNTLCELADKAPSNPNWADVLTGVATALLALAAFLALWQIRQARHARYAQAATEAARRWDDTAFRKTRARVQNEVDKGGPDGLMTEMMNLRSQRAQEYFELLAILDYFEDLEILYKSHAISFRIVNDSLGATIVNYWSIWKPFVVELRKRNNDVRNYENFENLAKRISNRRWYYTWWA